MLFSVASFCTHRSFRYIAFYFGAQCAPPRLPRNSRECPLSDRRTSLRCKPQLPPPTDSSGRSSGSLSSCHAQNLRLKFTEYWFFFQIIFLYSIVGRRSPVFVVFVCHQASGLLSGFAHGPTKNVRSPGQRRTPVPILHPARVFHILSLQILVQIFDTRRSYHPHSRFIQLIVFRTL